MRIVMLAVWKAFNLIEVQNGRFVNLVQKSRVSFSMTRCQMLCQPSQSSLQGGMWICGVACVLHHDLSVC